MWQNSASVITFFLFMTVCHAALQIVPGATWTASNTGSHIQAHGSGIIEEDGMYYMIGEDHTEGASFQNINCYSSPDLVQWTFVNALLSRTTGGDLGPNRVVERPKVLFNDKTKEFVMYLHIDSSDYQEAKVGVATSKTVCGDYDYIRSFQPLGFQSRDIGLFKDEDNSAYLLTEDRANGLRIDALDDDYLNVTRPVHLWHDSIESPAILKRDGYYFIFGSHLTGWSANDNVYSYATSLAGPWSAWATFADVGSNTYTSQTNYILPIGDWAVYMGDRWHAENLMRSTYVWLPLNISGTSVQLSNRATWAVDIKSKSWSDTSTSANVDGESATLTNGAKIINCSNCSRGKAAGWIGGPENGTAVFSGLQGTSKTGSTTLIVTYANGDESQRRSTVKINGRSQTVAFLPTGGGDITGTSVIHCSFSADSNNVVAFESFEGGYGPDIDVLTIL